MLLNVIVEIVEGLHLRQILCGNCDLVGVLYQGYEIHQVDTIELEHLLHRGLRSKLTLLDFELFFQQVVYLLNNFITCHNSKSCLL